jgi:hypothetical protein
MAQPTGSRLVLRLEVAGLTAIRAVVLAVLGEAEATVGVAGCAVLHACAFLLGQVTNTTTKFPKCHQASGHSVSRELLQRIQDLGVFGLLSHFVDLHPRNLAMFIHNEDRTIVHERYLVLCGGKDAIIRRRFRVRPAVSSERKLKTPKRFLESDMRENRISTDAHDLGVKVGKPAEVPLDCRQIVLSNGGEVKDVKTNHHILATMGGKLKLTLRGASRRAEPEIRRFISNLQCHLNLH